MAGTIRWACKEVVLAGGSNRNDQFGLQPKDADHCTRDRLAADTESSDTMDVTVQSRSRLGLGEEEKGRRQQGVALQLFVASVLFSAVHCTVPDRNESHKSNHLG